MKEKQLLYNDKRVLQLPVGLQKDNLPADKQLLYNDKRVVQLPVDPLNKSNVTNIKVKPFKRNGKTLHIVYPPKKDTNRSSDVDTCQQSLTDVSSETTEVLETRKRKKSESVMSHSSETCLSSGKETENFADKYTLNMKELPQSILSPIKMAKMDNTDVDDRSSQSENVKRSYVIYNLHSNKQTLISMPSNSSDVPQDETEERVKRSYIINSLHSNKQTIVSLPSNSDVPQDPNKDEDADVSQQQCVDGDDENDEDTSVFESLFKDNLDLIEADQPDFTSLSK